MSDMEYPEMDEPVDPTDAATPRGRNVRRRAGRPRRFDGRPVDGPRRVRRVVLIDIPPRPANYEAIIATNLGLEFPDDETAFELELGPNNCAVSRDAMTGD